MAKPKDEQCFMCHGTRVIRFNYVVVGAGKDGGNTEEAKSMPCYKCNSTGRLPVGHQAAWDRAKLAWCDCPPDEDRGPGAFHDDGQCAVEFKHHWHCPDCGKLQQVG